MLKKEKYETPDISVEKYSPVDILTDSKNGGLEYGNTDSTLEP